MAGGSWSHFSLLLSQAAGCLYEAVWLVHRDLAERLSTAGGALAGGDQSSSAARSNSLLRPSNAARPGPPPR